MSIAVGYLTRARTLRAMPRLDWEGANDRDYMRKHGSENVFSDFGDPEATRQSGRRPHRRPKFVSAPGGVVHLGKGRQTLCGCPVGKTWSSSRFFDSSRKVCGKCVAIWAPPGTLQKVLGYLQKERNDRARTSRPSRRSYLMKQPRGARSGTEWTKGSG